MKEAKFESLLREELMDLYDAEQQIIKALPKMTEAVSSEDLKSAFQEHLEQTEEQVRRLEQIFESMGEQAGSATCKGMQGLLEEGEKLIQEFEKSSVLEAALIGAAQKVEHYEIAAYGTACAIAEMFGATDAAELLGETLEEEKETDAALTEIAEQIMAGGATAEDVEDDGEEIEEDEEDVIGRKTIG